MLLGPVTCNQCVATAQGRNPTLGRTSLSPEPRIPNGCVLCRPGVHQVDAGVHEIGLGYSTLSSLGSQSDIEPGERWASEVSKELGLSRSSCYKNESLKQRIKIIRRQVRLSKDAPQRPAFDVARMIWHHHAQCRLIGMFQHVMATTHMVNIEATTLQCPQQTARRDRGQFGHAATATVMRRIGGSSGAS